MSSLNNVEINILSFNKDDIARDCGYCNTEKVRYAFEVTIDKYPVDIYDNMMKDGWRRSGDYVYIFNSKKSCCKFYSSRLNIEKFKKSKKQKKIENRFNNYLSGKYELNKEIKKEEQKKEQKEEQKEEQKKQQKKEQKKEVKMNNIEDELQEKIEEILRDYLEKKKYIKIIEKYIKIDNSLLEQKLNKIHVKKNKNKNKTFNFDYSIDFIYVTLQILKSKNQKNNEEFDNDKSLQLDLFNDFKEFYSSENEELELSDKTGHIMIKDKTKPKILMKPEKKEKEKEKEIHLPVKYIYTCELTDDIQITDEKFELYKKYQINVLKEPIEKVTKESFIKGLATTNLIDNKGIKLPSDLKEDSEHPFPKKYGTYNFIHRIDGKMIAVGVWDILPTSLSSVSLYYDPEYKDLELGTLTALKEIEYAKRFHDLIDNNFKYYTMGYYCETARKLRYKGFFKPTELLDRYTMNYVYLKDVQKLISDGEYHKLSEEEHNPNRKFMTEDEIDKCINDLIEDFNKKNEVNYLKEEEIKEKTKRFLEIMPTYLLKQIKFIAKPNK